MYMHDKHTCYIRKYIYVRIRSKTPLKGQPWIKNTLYILDISVDPKMY